MRFDRFTLKAQEAVQASQEIADTHNHQSIEPEHLLAALLDQEDGIAPSILQKLGVDPGLIKQQVEAEMLRSCEEMSALHSTDPTPDPLTFAYTEDRRKCERCPFKEVCIGVDYQDLTQRELAMIRKSTQ